MIHPGEGLPSSRIRILSSLPCLEELGAQVEAVTYPGALSGRRRLLRRANEFDLVVVHYKLPSLADGLLWRGLRPPLVYDFDDAISLRRLPKRGSHESRSRRLRFELACSLASGFTPGSRHLAGLIPDKGRPVQIVPSPVPIDVPRHAGGVGDPPRIGWVGGAGNLESVARLGPALAALARERRFVLVLISDGRIELEGVEVEHVPWTLEGQAAALAGLDVGIMPLADTPWNRGKCAYKLLQYMAAEVPCVASPVGMNAELIADGENGLLADSADEWRERLGRLLDEAELRRELGRAGRRTVEGAYDDRSVARARLEFYRRVIDGTGSGN